MKLLVKIAFFIYFLSIYNWVYSQQIVKNFTLKWNNNVEFKVNETKKITTSCIENNDLDANLNPIFNDKWEVENGFEVNNYTITNITFEVVSSSQANQFNISNIPLTLKSDFKIVGNRNKSYAVITLNPLIKEGNAVKKITSFTLNYNLKSDSFKSSKISIVKNSVLNSGTWYKFAIDTTGVFKIDKSFLQSLGINVSSINPKNIHIYGNGGNMLPEKNSDFRYDDLQENAILVQGESDGSFDDNDFILFYGIGPDTWKGAPNNLQHQHNIYSDKAYYFITINDTQGKRITSKATISGIASTIFNTFNDYTFFEKDEVNLFAIGQQWFGDNFSVENVHNYTIPFPGIDNSEPLKIKVRGVAESASNSSMSVQVNNQNAFSINYAAYSGLTLANANENNSLVNVSGDAVNISVTFNNNGNPTAKAFLDYIEVIGKKKLIATGKQFSFRNFNQLNATGLVEFTIQNNTDISQVWDVTNPLQPESIINEATDASFSFNASSGILNQFVALNDTNYYLPEKIDNSEVANQNLHALSNIDYLIVAPDYLMESAQQLANYHNQNSNLITQVVSLSQIYNEFSSGAQDVTAIRDFVKHLYDNSTTNKIKYVCLFGDASYDYKNRISGNTDVVPAFESYESFNLATSYVTDDYFGMMDSSEGDMNSFQMQDVATGRIPVSDVLQASKVVSKILNYYNVNTKGNWRTDLTLVADDIDQAGEETIEVNMEKIADTITSKKPIFNLKKIYIDAYKQETSAGGNRYPSVNKDITNQVQKGTLLVDYFGHGGEDGWAAERILEVSDIKSWTNFSKLPLFITATCEFTRFDNPLRTTVGELLFWNEKGGASSLVTTTREIYISFGESVNEKLMGYLLKYNNEDYSISQALMVTKNQFYSTQRYFIYDIGDPAMKLPIPSTNIVLTKMNDVPVSQSLDTIKALSYVKFEGEVTDESGNLLPDFNGEFNVSVYDKPVTKTTLDNDNHNFKMTFEAIESKIFNGRSKVENGKFSFDFVAPKDLKIAYGKGKLSFYASNSTTDKAGFNSDIIVGGLNANAPEDKIGPTIQLYLNDLNFVEGGTTNQNPVFIAVLEDSSGINTSITSIDHDIVAILDGDNANPIVLNDYFQTELNDFKKGKVNYQLSNLSPGMHTITLKAWDTYNNLSEATLTFFVVSDGDLVLTYVLNYPNPFVNYTEFWFNHNKPNELLNVQIQIFTISGKLVKTINQTVQSVGNLVRSITWNGLDDFGAKIGKGVYIYKLKVVSENSNSKAEKIEKLVILQ